MLNQFSRAELLYGDSGMQKLFSSKVIVFGIGGVGGYTVEALARSGVGTIAVVDDDKICLTNINRQIIATHSTIGKYKVDAAAERIKDINKNATVIKYQDFYSQENKYKFDLSQFDYVVDAIDTVSAKLTLIEQAKEQGVKIISCMGAGNKLHAEQLELTDIYKTTVCPLAKVMRYELKKRNIKDLTVVYSKEPALKPQADCQNSCKNNCVCPKGTVRKCTAKRQIPGSTAYVPPTAGLIIAGKVVNDLLGL